MGYYSKFTISAEPEPDDFSAMLEKYSGGYSFEYYGNGEFVISDSKWYSSDKDVLRMSQENPGIRFTYERIGEEALDANKYTIKNGRISGRQVLGWVDEILNKEEK